MLGLSNDYPNTFDIAKSVLTELKYNGQSINKLVVDVNPGLPKSVMKNLLHKPIGEKHASKKYDQFVLNTSF